VQKELLRLLEAQDPSPALERMESAGILALILRRVSSVSG